MIKKIRDEVIHAIKEAYERMYKEDYISYILYIGRADVIPGLKAYNGTDCVIDYQLDRYISVH